MFDYKQDLENEILLEQIVYLYSNVHRLYAMS